MNFPPARTVIIISGSSDIGCALALHYRSIGSTVVATYRNWNENIAAIQSAKGQLVALDLADRTSIDRACQQLASAVGCWDLCVVCPGTLDPIGPFAECDIDQWEENITQNLSRPVRLVHRLLPSRRPRSSDSPDPLVVFFSGSGSNGVHPRFSGYTVSKVGLIKATEVLASEVADCRFCILGPGWVRTKIHQQTIQAGELAGEAYQATVDRLQSGNFAPMDQVIAGVETCYRLDGDVISGRNISLVHDHWSDSRLHEALAKDRHMYTLRRAGNDWKTQDQ